MVASVLAVRPGKQNKSMVDAVNQQAEQAAPSTYYANTKPPAPLTDQAAVSAGSPANRTHRSALQARKFGRVGRRGKDQVSAFTGAKPVRRGFQQLNSRTTSPQTCSREVWNDPSPGSCRPFHKLPAPRLLAELWPRIYRSK